VKILGFDTSSEACTAALRVGEVVIERFDRGGRHAERLLGMVDELLDEAGFPLTQVDAIAFGRGPGSFTGLRIAAGVAQGLAFGAGLPVVPVSSLAALAQGVDAPNVAAGFDARMNQVYWGAFRRGASGLVEAVGEETVIDPAAVSLPPGRGWVGAGSGWDVYGAMLSARLGDRVERWERDALPQARDLVALAVAACAAGRTVSPDEALPVYLRDDVAKKPAKA